MKLSIVPLSLLLVALSFLNQPPVSVADSDAKSATVPADATKRGRLPANYGKIGLSDDQRERIYALQSSYEARLAPLREELERLTQDRDSKIEETLTAGQRQRLKELKAAKQKPAT